jgi:hypothetical protein
MHQAPRCSCDRSPRSIDGDALLAEFRENADDAAIQDQIRRHLDEAAARAFGVEAG